MKKIVLSNLFISIIFLCTYLFSIFHIRIFLNPLMEEDINKFIYYSNFTIFINYIIAGCLGCLFSNYFVKNRNFKHHIFAVFSISIMSLIIHSTMNGFKNNLIGVLSSLPLMIILSSIGYLIGYVLILIIFYLTKKFKKSTQ